MSLFSLRDHQVDEPDECLFMNQRLSNHIILTMILIILSLMKEIHLDSMPDFKYS